ncbi:E3 ubiquitin-protein ligase TRAIP [Rhipicephalus microplus]|uniref:E3 ubiquitin-protein ligase TRAIP n=1 Tax=Rhipicephalus microplus TaxID=6941 RepID=UPI00188821D4|nr:E3 ubiquitin-protein ligase TRAIP-like [Rhipicephalus microplus]
MKFTCSICMDNFSSENIDNINATGCGHVFHEMCLLHWTEMSKTCPACRKPLRPKQVFKLYFNLSETKEVDVGDLQNKLDDAKAQLRAANVEKIKQQEAADTLKAFLIQREEEVQKFKDKYMTALGEKSQLQAKIQSMRKEVSEKRQLYDENIALRSRVTDYESLRKLIDSNAKEAEELLKSYAEGPGALKLLSTYCCLVKRQLQTVTDSRSQLNKEALDLRKKVAYLEVLSRERAARIRTLEGDVSHLKEMLHRAELKAEKSSASASTSANDSIIAESPAPERLKRPRLTNPEETPSPGVASPALRIVTSAWHSKPPDGATPTREPLLPRKANFFRPPAVTDSFKSVIRTGYNGLGGHSKHIVGSKPSLKKF